MSDSSVPKFDPNMWYQLWTGNNDGQSYVGTVLYANSGTFGATYFNTTDNTANNQKWQIMQLNSTSWIMRSADGGPNAYQASELVAAETTEGQTRPCMARGDVAGAGAFWTFTPWGDGTYYLTNAANGTSYHLNRKDTGTMAMSPNITAPQDGQRWQWKTISAINNAKYSTIGLAGATIATSSTSSASSSASTSTASSTSASASSSSSPSPSAAASSSGALSTGAKAAIGATIGVIAFLGLILFALFLLKRRKKQNAYTKTAELPPNEIYYNDGAVKYEMHHPMPPVELQENQRPVELMGDPVSINHKPQS